MNFNQEMRNRVRKTAEDMRISQKKINLAADAHRLTCSVLNDWGSVSVGGQLGLESLGHNELKRNQEFDAVKDGDVSKLMQGLQKIGYAPRHIEEVAEQCLSIYDGEKSFHSIVSGGQQVDGKHAPMSMVVGRTQAGKINLNQEAGLEAFGVDSDRLNTDDRLTMDLAIMRPAENIMDKALARVSSNSPVVTIRVPSPEAFDWGKTQEANSTVESRYGESNTYRMRDLYRNPVPVNSAPKRIVPLAANDSKDQLWNDEKGYYKVATTISTLDLAKVTTDVGGGHIDRTDLVADGAIVDKVIVSLKAGSTTEYFGVDTRVFELAMFNISPSSKDSGQRQVILDVVLPLNEDTKQWDGTASTLAAQLTDAKIRVAIRLNATLNIKNGLVEASGTSSLTLVPLADGTAISGATTTLFGTMTSTVVAYGIESYYNEENMRKANLALWVQYYEMQFVVPRSRIYFTDYSIMGQEADENAIAFTSSTVALGNGRRGLDTIVNALNDIAAGQKFLADNPEIASVNSVGEQSFAQSLVKPTVVSAKIDFGVEELNTMNESTRLVEIHGRFRARLLSMATALFAKSLMLNQYKAGERPVLKAWVHSTIADLVIGITDYHPELNDKEATATGADYSMVLPNGYRLDVIKSNFDCLQQRIYIVPVIESDMSSIISAAQIRDCGTVSTNYIPTINGASTRRFATTTREIVMMTNKVGLMLEVVGLQTQLGAIGHDAVALAPNYSEDLAV